MKKLIVLLPLMFAVMIQGCGSSSGNTAGEGNHDSGRPGKGIITFREYEHDFGKVAQGEKIAYTFTFGNEGTEDIILKSVSTSCGCTVPKYDKKPVAPGEEGSLEVVFDTSGRQGQQTKTITVKSNASKPVVLLRITAEVEDNNLN
ncbi:MAG TPA: DUF1573 domain-containing protein [Bacteroidales bacterium]|nr:DUF1573 domain-containing protein [Bacteroidales bacterium]